MVRCRMRNRIVAWLLVCRGLLIGLLLLTPVLGPSVALALEAGQVAPAFSLAGGGNGTVSLVGLRGKVVYVDFWASWCVPCKQSFPWLDSLQQRYGRQGLVIVGVNLDQQRSEADRFLARWPVGFTIAFDPAGDTAKSFGVSAMPSSYLVDRQGRVQLVHRGFRDSDKMALESEIRRTVGAG